MTDRERLFVAVPLAEETRLRLREHIAAVTLPGRPVSSGSWHLTLRFLGDTAPSQRDGLVDALRQARLGRQIAGSFGGWGAFPRPARASVIWLGVRDGGEQLRGLAAHVETAARSAGFPAEDREWTPHLTLSRLHPARDVRRLLAEMPSFVEPFPVDAVVLFRSHLGRGPARYQELARFPLPPG